MRWFFLLLLLANVVLLILGIQHERSAPQVVAVTQNDVGELKLLSELDESGRFKDEEVLPSTDKKRVEESSTEKSAKQNNQPVSDATDREKSELSSTREISSTSEAQQSVVQSGSAPEEPPEVNTEPVVTEKAADEKCGALGPIELGSRARSIAEELKWLDIDASLRYETYKKQTGFQVMVPPLENRAKATRLVGRLEEAEIEDFHLFYRGGLENGISLGIYNRRINAEQRKKAIADKGFESQIIQRFSEEPAYWIDYRIRKGADVDSYSRMEALHPELKIEEYVCPRVVTTRGIH